MPNSHSRPGGRGRGRGLGRCGGVLGAVVVGCVGGCGDVDVDVGGEGGGGSARHRRSMVSSSSLLLSYGFVLTVLLLVSWPTPSWQQQQVFGEEVWERGDIVDLMQALDCDNQRPEMDELEIPSQDTWQIYRTIYEQVVTPERSSLPKGGDSDKDTFFVPYTILHGPYGRGIHAKESIPRGTLIWKSIQTARFETAAEYRTFLRALPPPHMACDVLHWAYTRVEDLVERPPLKVVVCVDLDPGTFVNECSHVEECNMESVSHRGMGCTVEFRATRDIAAGEELLVDYSTFNEHNPGWAAMGLHNNRGVRPLRLVYADKEHQDQNEDEVYDDRQDDGDNGNDGDEEDFEGWPSMPLYEDTSAKQHAEL